MVIRSTTITLLLLSLGLLLGRVFNILRENDPELAGDRCRTIMRPPQVHREGNCVCELYGSRIHRQPEHVMTFLLVEMETSGSLDGQQRLVVKGRFAPKAFEGIMQSYVNCLLDCLDLSSEYHTLDVANRIGAAVYVQKQKDQRKHRKRPKAKHSQWRGKVKGLVDGEKKYILAQQAETLLHSLRLRFSDLQQTVLDMSKIQHSKQCLPIAQPMSISNFS
ncbi:eukaryotic translation initiation factor 2 subunit beta-like [Actinidia eriantha]|uniref:eukaryotic translation initiation factor 2 subunit beta-like n=1 Tax=Actinidia eriantha TaxID=165200 RepID=UPI0025879037|nr:eukaryotic translation initiation factor 2 subunit beta-like [Actinidia eriantha]